MDEAGKENFFIIDGYPRNQDNIDGWKEVFGDSYKLICTLFLSCTEESCVSRLLKRGETSGRKDDEEEVIKKRFQTFYKESLPILDALKEMGPVIEIPSTSSPDEVCANIFGELDKLLN